MPVYEYKAFDSSGNPMNGTLFSTSLATAAADLAKQGLNVQHVALASNNNDPIPQSFTARPIEKPAAVETVAAPVPEPTPAYEAHIPPPTEARPAIVTDVIAPLVYKVPLNQLLFFFRQLSTMLNAGVPIVSSLDTLSRQAKDPKLAPIIKELLGHVREGRELSVGMQRYPEVFSPLMLGLIRAGEQGGMLDKSLLQMANYVEQEIRLRNLLRKATLYPKIVIFASIFIILAANYIISDVFNKPGGIYSPLTQPATWFILGPLLVFLFLFFRIGVSNPRAKFNYDHVLLNIPIIGPVVHQMAMAKFARAFAALYKGGVAMPKAMKLSADACGNEYLRSQMYPVADMLDQGAGFTDSLRQTRVFTPQVLDMAQTGETTGRIDDMLDKVADYYEDDSEVRANQLAMIFGVMCLIAVGIYVGYIAIHFYSGPQFQSYQQAGNE
ncbi:MAG TPA: type II secretion system F family protein [Fimbriimonadaceae bacterium]|jgi:type II secretory pathway component PulF